MDPTGSGMPLGCLPGSKIALGNQKSRFSVFFPTFSSISQYPVAHAGIPRHRAWVQEIGGSTVYLLGVRLSVYVSLCSVVLGVYASVCYLGI